MVAAGHYCPPCSRAWIAGVREGGDTSQTPQPIGETSNALHPIANSHANARRVVSTLPVLGSARYGNVSRVGRPLLLIQFALGQGGANRMIVRARCHDIAWFHETMSDEVRRRSWYESVVSKNDEIRALESFSDYQNLTRPSLGDRMAAHEIIDWLQVDGLVPSPLVDSGQLAPVDQPAVQRASDSREYSLAFTRSNLPPLALRRPNRHSRAPCRARSRCQAVPCHGSPGRVSVETWRASASRTWCSFRSRESWPVWS